MDMVKSTCFGAFLVANVIINESVCDGLHEITQNLNASNLACCFCTGRLSRSYFWQVRPLYTHYTQRNMMVCVQTFKRLVDLVAAVLH